MATEVLSHERTNGEPEYVYYQVRSETNTRQIEHVFSKLHKQYSLRAHSHREKAEAKAQIFFVPDFFLCIFHIFSV